jgi:hypothetical protein
MNNEDTGIPEPVSDAKYNNYMLNEDPLPNDDTELNNYQISDKESINDDFDKKQYLDLQGYYLKDVEHFGTQSTVDLFINIFVVLFIIILFLILFEKIKI